MRITVRDLLAGDTFRFQESDASTYIYLGSGQYAHTTTGEVSRMNRLSGLTVWVA